MAFDRFDTPGFLNDLDETGKKEWSQWVSDRLNEAKQASDSSFQDFGPRPQFFNPLTNPPDSDAQEKDITWTAFPRIVQIHSVSDKQRWQRADSSRSKQDEYCEWSVLRDPQTGKINSVTFTSEGPEYWQFLAEHDPAAVLRLYRQHIGLHVQETDLFQDGEYVPTNRWNCTTTDGAMHLIQRANTLRAEIELAAAATLVRQSNGRLLTDAQELIACGKYGQPERHSDPHIGAVVNELARNKSDITLANPIGLYIAGLSVAGWMTPDGADPMAFWAITRGTPDKALRAVFEVPASKGYVVGDIQINGRNIEFGAQIADFITIKLTGLATRIGKSAATSVGCVKPALVTVDLTMNVEAEGASLRFPGRGGFPENAIVKELDPRLRRMVRDANIGPIPAVPQSFSLLTAEEAAAAPARAIAPGQRKHVLVQLSPDVIPSAFRELDWHRIVGGIYTVHVPLGRLESLATSEQVKFVEIGRPMRPDLDTSVHETKTDLVHKGSGLIPSLKGEGIVVGIIDYGFDFTLDDFLDSNGKTRIDFLWDQQLTPQANETHPKGFSYGVEYTAADIDAARGRSDPFASVRHKPAEGSHGTHVAGIAIGNGDTNDATFQRGKFIGAAPEARIILVQPGYDKLEGETLADSPRVSDAVDYIFEKAQGTPCVVNLSLGQNGGSHDGESVVERTIDRLLEEPGRALVVAGGNEHTWRTHASGTLGVGGKRTLHWCFGGPIPSFGLPPQNFHDRTPNEMSIWYSSRDVFAVRVIDPLGRSTPIVNPDDTNSFILGGNEVYIDSERFTQLNGEARIFIEVREDTAQLQNGTWIVEIDAIQSRSGRFDAWIERDDRDPRVNFADQSFFEDPDFDPAMTLGTPATARRAIAVANYDHVSVVVSGSSGRGKTRDQRNKPEISAPGTKIYSSCAMAGRNSLSGTTVAARKVMSGTSMAAPHVAGIVALLFERGKRMATPRLLTAEQVRKILIASASQPSGTTNFEDDWGFGRVDAEEAVKLIT